jgi:ubiquinone/menaquinone biosynthesis C-methylase UbiE
VTPCDCCGSNGWQPLFVENGIQLGKCPVCDLHSIESIPEPEARMTEMEEGHYAGDLEILDADKQITLEKVMTAMFQRYVDIAKPLVPGGTWLDIGCGAGLLISLAQKAGYTGEGLELNADRRAAAIKQTGVTVHSEPIEALGLPDNSVDVISLINVFSHLTAPSQTFTELKRILKPGGVLVMATGEMTDGVQKSHMFNWNLGDHLYFLGDRTIDRYADELGFEILEHRRAWLPDEMFSKEWLTLKGRDPRKNALKTAIRVTPGGLKLLRAVMLRRQADSKAHSGVFALRPLK